MKHSGFIVTFLSLALVVSCSENDSNPPIFPVKPTDTFDGGHVYTAESFNYKDTHSADYHPLFRKKTTFSKMEEIALIIPGVPNYGGSPVDGWVLDDANSSFGEMGTLSSLFFSGTDEAIHASLSGDFDNDGKDEMAIASIFVDHTYGAYNYDSSNYIRITIIDDAEQNFVLLNEKIIGSDNDCYLHLDMAIGDIDNDGSDEIILGTIKGELSQGWDFRNTEGGIVYCLDDVAGDFVISKEMAYTSINSTYQYAEDIHVAAGNMDNDDGVEFAVYVMHESTLYYGMPDYWDVLHVYDDASNSYSEIHTAQRPFSSNISGQPDLTSGDIDGDGRDELVLLYKSGYYIHGRALDDIEESFTLLEAIEFQIGASGYYFQYDSEGSGADYNPYFPNPSWTIALGDLNKDGKDELSIVTFAYNEFLNDTKIFFSHYVFDKDNTDWYEKCSFIELGLDTYPTNGIIDDGIHLAIADDDDDLANELYISRTNTGDNKVCHYRYSSHLVGGHSHLYETNTWNDSIDLGSMGRVTPFLVPGDYDGDNFAVSYTGEKHLTLPDPMIMVAMATPPLQEGITQNKDFSGTSYGTYVSQGSSTTHEIGVSVGITLSFEFGDPLEIAETSVEYTLEEEFTRTETASNVTTTGVSYTAAYPDDYVIFQGTLYQCYKYKIISHSDPDKVGTYMTIDVPVDRRIYKWTTDYFNNSFSGISIGTETFSHSVGDVSSYPGLTERDQIALTSTNYYQSDLHMVGQGGGVISALIDLSEESITGDSYSIGVTLKGGYSIAGAGYSCSTGVKTTNTYEISVGTSTAYEGTVGDIGAGDWADYRYSFGLFIYDLERANGIKYQVINYWVQDLGPAY